jgi:hypothetical protein
MIINGGLREGQFNYDTQIGRFQLRKSKLTNSLNSIKDMDLVHCDLSGIMENCSFVSCNIGKARIYNSKFISNNNVQDSYMEGVSVNKSNEIARCYVVNNEEIINCPVKESVIKFASPGKAMEADDKTTVLMLRKFEIIAGLKVLIRNQMM